MSSPSAAHADRRRFLLQLPIATAALASFPSCTTHTTASRPVRFGLITDIHQDIMHDGVQRVSAFVDAMNHTRPDFVIQLGDFCIPHERNRPFLEAWNRFDGPRHHVLGNHDMDGGFKPEQAVAFYGMPARHHTFQYHGLKFLVLDGNEPGGTAAGYKRHVSPQQLDWISGELASGTEPIIVFIHQSLDHSSGIDNQAEVRATLERSRGPDGSPRVLAVFSGHHHQDWTQTLSSIHHLQMNSASYQWVGEKYTHPSYPDDILKSHPTLRSTCPYRDPLWALVTIDPARGTLVVEGRSSEWVGASPSQLGIPTSSAPPESVIPAIRSRRLGRG